MCKKRSASGRNRFRARREFICSFLAQVATFIVQKILLDEVGLTYICATADRFYAVSTVLNNMVRALVETPSHRLLKHIIRCYLRLADNLRARDALRQQLPEELRDNTFLTALRVDPTATRWQQQLVRTVFPDASAGGSTPASTSGGASLTGGMSAPPPPAGSGIMLPSFQSS
jgi:CCR4-NOT transcription complex subunit 9